ncbi:MAG: hypothetical protein JWN51_684 [Phycisphaerales bacterium]|nr:hypothetical protein [Phycisphaerales bacterium]
MNQQGSGLMLRTCSTVHSTTLQTLRRPQTGRRMKYPG